MCCTFTKLKKTLNYKENKVYSIIKKSLYPLTTYRCCTATFVFFFELQLAQKPSEPWTLRQQKSAISHKCCIVIG